MPNFLSSKLARGKGVVFEKVEELEIHFALHSLQAPSKAGASGWILKVELELEGGRWWRRLPAACMPTGSAHGGGFLASRWEEWWCGLSKATWQLW